MLANVHAVAGCIAGGQHVVEKYKRPDATAFPRGQRAQDRLAFDIFGAGADHGEGGHGGSSLSGFDGTEHNPLGRMLPLLAEGAFR